MSEHIPVLIGAARTPTGKFLGSLALYSLCWSSIALPSLQVFRSISSKIVVKVSGVCP